MEDNNEQTIIDCGGYDDDSDEDKDSFDEKLSEWYK